ncbi:TLR4 interactor with leucine rich repeats-like [Toxorhynchites rutilus septentrionalis]|uniref:TLR4 interactor with leucine rich repeats-like n=1 Tax=Toxorhynchites rutilus septentrionalis TaxID=329112 RepID=UPI002479E25D|nr:TLR4 interactor with leucine rich repeats-like [Toxorhynchites rutilus septentrionalis]
MIFRVTVVLLIVTSFATVSIGRAVADRRKWSQEITHLESATDGTLPILPKATELIIESIIVDHWNEALFSRLENTKYLTFLYGNIPKMSFRSTKLETLSAIQLNLTTFEVAREENHSLKTLQLSRNRLSTLSPNFRFLVGLVTLDLSQNDLTFINLNLFATMRQLKNLDLSVNKIANIEATTDLRLNQLHNLWVSYNQLNEFESFPAAFPALKTVRLIGNLWTCAWVDRARKLIMDKRIVAFGVDYGCGEYRQGGLCCYGELSVSTSTESSLLKEGPLFEEIQRLTGELATKPLSLSSGQTLELLTQNGKGSQNTILVGAKSDKVTVFFR